MAQDDEPDRFRQARMTNYIFQARDDFFRFVAGFDTTEKSVESRDFSSLYTYFDEWALDVSSRYESQFVIDYERYDEIWGRFLRLVPTIYVSIIDAYLQDTTLLAFKQVNKQSGEIVMTMRSVVNVLPTPLVDEDIAPREHDTSPFSEFGERKSLDFWSIAALVVGGSGNWPKVDFNEVIYRT
jgi:hypothetical protein